MVDSSCGGTFLHKTVDEAWDLFENLSDNSQQHTTSSRIGTSWQIGNRGMYEGSQNEQVNSAQRFHKTEQPIFKYILLEATRKGKSIGPATISTKKQFGMTAPPETQIGQLANAISRRNEGKLPSHLIENPRANYHGQVKAISTLRNEKLVDNKVGAPIKDDKLNENETERIDIGTKIERKIEKELASSSNSKTLESSLTASYKLKGDGLMFYICYNFCMTYT
ncbi:hypothetical protein M9H77_23146 [Catharanthus roseus]|uniref:Uncharacterized protein n=1 Tax=Catharanthus roseus TaxID=4058 RepID=A0ACC0AS64_CATRO|nr:hypothetical protein M9H77_23146 [Catharanthus roseus]